MDAGTLKELWNTHVAQPTEATAELLLLNTAAFARTHAEGKDYPWAVPMSMIAQTPEIFSEKQLADMLDLIVRQVEPSYAHTIMNTLMTSPLQHSPVIHEVILKAGLSALLTDSDEKRKNATARNVIEWVLHTKEPAQVHRQLDIVARRIYRAEQMAETIAGCGAFSFGL